MISRLGMSTNCERARLWPLLLQPKWHVSIGLPVLRLVFELALYVGHYLVSSTGDAE